MSFDCRLHIAVTPYSSRYVPEGIKAVESFDPAKLGRRSWPRICHGKGRCPEGGIGGQIVAEQILIVWRGNQLIFPISDLPKPLAERPPHHETEIHYYGSFLAQLDGQVAYEPSAESNCTHYLILVESPVAELHAIRFDVSQTVVLDAYIKHSMPIPLEGQFQFNAWHRSVNAVLQMDADSAGIKPLVVNLCKVNRVEPITLRRVGLPVEEALPAKKVPKPPHLPHSFAKDLKQLNDVAEAAFAPYGQLIHDFSAHNEQQPSEMPWPGTDSAGDGMAGTLSQQFQVAWKQAGNGQFLELEFEGLSGSFAGEKGRPGVEYSPELGSYRANLLMARPDGSFYLQPADFNDAFAMAVALPDAQTGEPLDNSLQAFIFRNGQALRLAPGVWHSVPIPLAGTESIVFTEVVAATNANLVANVRQECGHPVQFVQSV